MSVLSFSSYEEFQEHLKKVRSEATEATSMEAIKRVMGDDLEGGYSVNLAIAEEFEDPSLIVFNRVIGRTEFLAQGDDPDSGGLEYYAARWIDQLTTGFLLVQAFSLMCPDGEWGDCHITRHSFPITKEQFEQARADNWYLGELPKNLTPTGLMVRDLVWSVDDSH